LRLHHPAGHNDTSQEASHRTWTFKTTTVIKTTGLPGLSTTDINHRLLGKTTKWEPISYTLHHPTVHPIWPPTSASTTFMYNPVLSVVRIDAKQLGNQYIVASIMEVLSLVLQIQSVYSLFFAIYPKLLKLLYFVAFIPQE